MSFMHEGGIAMWLTLALFVAAFAAALIRRDKGGSKIAMAGAAACIASGLAGFSTGVYATVSHLAELDVARRAEILGAGLHESVNNTLFAGLLALVLAIVAVALSFRAPVREIA